MWQSCVQLALRQEGLITLDQAISLGCSPQRLKRHVASDDLERVLPGVYRLSGFPATPRQHLKAICLWGGQGTAASHASAAALVGLKGFTLCDLHAVTTRNPQRLPRLVTLHPVPAPVPGVRSIVGVPVTPPWITLIDLGSVAPEEECRRALHQAIHLGLVSVRKMRWALETFGRRCHKGTRVMRGLVDELDPNTAPPESELERLFYSLVEHSDLPPGARQHWAWDGTQWRRFDWAWVDIRVGVELDGKKTHGTDEAFEDDRARDRALRAEGWETLRYTWNDVTRHPREMLAELRKIVAIKKLAMRTF